MEWKEVIKPWTDAVEQWERRITTKYIFPGDEQAIGRYNQDIKGNQDYELQLNLPPHPFAGNPYAPIWVINLNPGYNEEADKEDFENPDGDGWKWSIAQLKGEISCNYYLRLPDLGSKKKGACNWWKKYLVSQNICNGNIEIADKFFSLDYFPYHSKKYKDPGKNFESTKLFKKIINWGIEREVLFLFMRNKKKFVSMFKDEIEQKKIKIMYALSQASWISYGNLCTPEQYCRTERDKEKNIKENKPFIESFLNR